MSELTSEVNNVGILRSVQKNTRVLPRRSQTLKPPDGTYDLYCLWSSSAHWLSFIASTSTRTFNHCKLLKKKKFNQNEIGEQLYFHEIKTSDFPGIFLHLFVKYFGFHIILRVIMLFKILINLTMDQFIFEIAIFKSNYKRLCIYF